jgi:hypothetical protein
MYHTARSEIYKSLVNAMENPELLLFPDAHYRKVVICAGSEIADYPEQVLLAGVSYGWCA